MRIPFKKRRTSGKTPPSGSAPGELYVVRKTHLDKPFITRADVSGLPADTYICNTCGIAGRGEPKPPANPLKAKPGTCLTCGRLPNKRRR